MAANAIGPGFPGRVATYWHMLPQADQARKAVWDAVNPKTGKRRIDEAFPHELRAQTRDSDMFIRFHSGSTYQVVGSDNFESLIGSPPAGIVFSEWSKAKPQAWALLSPILAENKGWALFIYTPRGRNHGQTLLERAREGNGWFGEVLTAHDTKVLTLEELEQYRLDLMGVMGAEEGDAHFRQEMLCDFSAATIGAILGRYVEMADSEGRIHDDVGDDAPVVISSDIGFRDTATWWFWQIRKGGFDLVDYDEASGLDAEEWIPRLQEKPYDIQRIWLPQDAKVKTFQSKHSSLERFLQAFGPERVKIVPAVKVADRINAARVVIKRCQFHRTKCKAGLEGLREWSFEYNEDTQSFSKNPLHDWASHPGDGYSYGAVVLQEEVAEAAKPSPADRARQEGHAVVSLSGGSPIILDSYMDAWDHPKVVARI